MKGRYMLGRNVKGRYMRESHTGKDLALLTLRLITGGLLAGHGAQKLFGWFGGHGLRGTANWLEPLGLRPSRLWALAAGLGEFGGGVLTALGLFHPLGPITMLAPMSVAVGKVHWGKPIWVTQGGAELPVTNIAIATALALVGPGRLSLDRAFRIRVPWAVVAVTAGAVAAGVAVSLTRRPAPAPAVQEEAHEALEGGEEAPAPKAAA